MHYFFSYSSHNCCLPSKWKTDYITPIFKSSNKTSVTMYHRYLYYVLPPRYSNKLFMTTLYILFKTKFYPSVWIHGRMINTTATVSFPKWHSCKHPSTDWCHLSWLCRGLWSSSPQWAVAQTLENGDFWLQINFYFSNRSQSVLLSGSYSSFLSAVSNVPHESILFLVCTNNLFSSVQFSNALSFADNTKLL